MSDLNEKKQENKDNENNTILNLVSTLLNKFNVASEYDELKEFDKSFLNKENILFFIFDGLGYNFLQKSNADFLKNNIDRKLKTVFPATTSAAMTTFYTGLPPIEHSLIGWSMYFKEYFKMVDVLTKEDSYTKELFSDEYYFLDNVPEITIFQKIRASSPETEIYFVCPEKFIVSDYTKKMSKGAQLVTYQTINEIPVIINDIAEKNDNKKFVFTYSPQPDSDEHIYGVNSEEAHATLIKLNNLTRRIYQNRSYDSTIIITADHGLVNSENIIINDDKELTDALMLPPYPENRFFTLFIKHGKISFMEDILDKYKKDFLILTKKQFIESEYLGKDFNNKTYDFIGDYVLIAKSDKGMKMNIKGIDRRKEMIGHHSGITDDEIYVPLIILK